MNSFDEISEWKVATMENSKQFSALGFLIGKRMIKKDSDVPIGLISSSLGGSSIMQWIPTYSVNWDSQAKRMMAGASSKGGLYTQRLLPLKNLKASAVVWYQGEANTTFESGTVYEQALTSLINNWRKTFNDEDLPFVVIQLPTANFAKIYSTIRIGTGVRAGQWNVSQRMDNVKTVVSNDTGTTNNVHPNDKGPIADRAVAYIEDFINNTQSNVESPSFDYMERSGDKLILHFKNTYGSLSTDDGGVPLGFELKDDDGIYKDVTPTINGDTIEIDVTDITNPQVKYAWSDTPGIAKDLVEAQTDTPAVINTFNAAGRPIAPFMTDLTEKYASKAVNKELSTTEFYNYAPYISKVEQSGDDIVISAYDTDGVVSKVEVYIDEGEIKAGDAKQRDDGKWVFTPDVTSGVHSVYAIATDNDNINSLTCVDYTTYNIIRPTRYDYVKGYTESPSSVEYNNGDDMLAKATNDVNGTTTTVTSAIPTGETTKSLKLSATGNKATANATIPISKADNPQKTLTIEYDTMFESADDAIGASRGMYAKTKEGNELWLTYFTASSLRTAITNTGGNWCYEQAMSIKNNQWHHIKLELHPNTGIFSIWLDGTMLQDNVSFVKEGSSFDTCKGAFDTLKEGITDLRFYHTASNNIENATYIDNVKVTEVSYSEEEIIPPAKIQEATPQISIDYINETLTGFESQEPYTIKVGEGNAKDITLGEGVTTISLDDEKIGYAGELLSIEIVKKARNTETYTDSDVQQLTVKARPKAPTTVQGVNATEIGGKGKLTGMNGMQYKLKRTDEWSSTQLVDTVEVDAGEYNVRKAATDTDFASEETTITVETFIAEKEMTPEIAIDYTTEELINFVEDGTYTINGLDVTLTDNKLSLANYITNEQITLSIVKKGNNVTTVASEAQTLIVKARPAAPTKSEIIVTQPSVIGGKGTIAGIADTMEYSTNNGINWTTGDGDDIGDIEPGTTYKIRYKAVSADEEAERQFKSAEYSVTIIAYDAMPETQPTISINYVNEKLTGFTEGCDYIIKIDDGVATDKDNVTEDIDIDNTYFGHTLKIVKKGDGIKTSNSEAFELSIPKRSSAPNVAAVEEQTYQGNDGKITGVDTTMEYKSLSEPTFTWTQCAGTEITNLAPGSYIVRVAAVADESFASEVMSVTINAAAKDEPTEPTVNITYDDKNGNVNAIFTNITEEGMVYVAEYNENGTLLSIKLDEISDSVIIPFTCVNKSKVKVFIWKNDMKPLFNKVFTLN